MQFDAILGTLRDHGKSGLAYSKTVEHAERAMKEDPERAAAYHLLCAMAERYLESTGRLPVTTVQTEAAYRAFEEQAKTLEAACSGGDAATILRALNAVALVSREPMDVAARPEG